MVDLVILHGPPASGKLTIAKELNGLIGARVFHNHLTLDFAKSLLNFGEPGFWDLVRDLRFLSLRSFFEYGTETAITTWCYEEPEDKALFVKIKTIATSANGRIFPVFLDCDMASLESRVESTHRLEMEKLCDVGRLREVMGEKNYGAIPDESCMKINSAAQSARLNAQHVVREFSL